MREIRGVSKKTLVEDNELFLFEDEVEPLLAVLCGKTLECARMEVLEEEELAEMKRKQAQLDNLNKLEQADVQRMEEEEAYRLKTHEAKKNLQRQKKIAQRQAHEKIVSRTLSKQYTSGLRQNVVNQLFDIGFFYNRFNEVTLKTNVIPWILDNAEKFVKELQNFEEYPNNLIRQNYSEISEIHKQKISQYKSR